GQGTMSGSDTGSGVATATTDPSANSAPGQQPSSSTTGTLQPATATPDTSGNNSLGNSPSGNNPSGNNPSGNNPSSNNSTDNQSGVASPPPRGSVSLPHPNSGDQENKGGLYSTIGDNQTRNDVHIKHQKFDRSHPTRINTNASPTSQPNVSEGTSTSKVSSGFRQVGSKVPRAPATVALTARASISSNAVKLSTPRVTSIHVSTPHVNSAPKVNVPTPRVNVSTPRVNVSTPRVNVSTPGVNASVNVSTPRVNA